jgi:hypothetical protein
MDKSEEKHKRMNQRGKSERFEEEDNRRRSEEEK